MRKVVNVKVRRGRSKKEKDVCINPEHQGFFGKEIGTVKSSNMR